MRDWRQAMMGRSRALLLILLVFASSVSAAEIVDHSPIADEIRQTRLDPDSAIKVSGFTLDAGLASVILDSGLLVPATPVAGRAVEFVFIGEGRLELEPPDEIEAGQMELFTGTRSMEESFEQAVFVVALDAAAETVSRGERAVEDAEFARAESVFGEWLAGPERKLLDIEARIFADAVGDRLAAGFFCGSFEGTRLDRFLYVVDPLADEQVTVGQFVAPDLSRGEERRARRTIEKAQRRGKLIGLEVEDLGDWDTWLSCSQTDGEGQPFPGLRGVEPNDYEIDVTLRGRDLAMEASATISMRVVVDDLRVVAFEMKSDLVPVAVVDGEGRELVWFRSAGELVVALARPARVGDELVIRIDYTGFPIEKVASGAFVQRNTTGWYPHGGTIDRATYTVTVRHPEKLDIVAPGSLVARGDDPDGLEWRRWRLDRISMGYSFEVGRYDIARGRAGEVQVTVAVDKLGRKAEKELADEILTTVVDVLDYYGGIFGPYPLDNLQVVSSPRGYSQGLLGMVSLSTTAVVDWDVWGALLGLQDRRTIIAHEIAHQWWGNLVGWRGYRDQWISEAMANYAALLWARNRVDRRGEDRLGWGPTANWQSELLRTTEHGRPIESLGPLVLGVRLDSSISSRAYPAIVYKKGAVVLDMLSRSFREGAFTEILGEFVEVASDRVISTDVFLRGISSFGGTDLEWFSKQYVYGTGLPVIHYSTSFEELDDGRWAVVGTATQRTPYRYRVRVVETENEELDLRRTPEAQFDVSESMLVVPFQIGLAGTSSESRSGRRHVAGRVLLSGVESPFRIEIAHRPEVVWFDREKVVFGRFFAADRWPKRDKLAEGSDRETAGEPEAARRAYVEALDAPVSVVPPGWEDFFRDVDVVSEGDRLDARTRLALTSLDLDDGALASAKTEFEMARDLVKSRDRWLLDHDLLVIESRLMLLSGDSQSAFRLLKKRVLGKRRVASPETWALLAIAAHQVGNTEVFDRARTRAGELDVDLGPLVRVDD